MATFADADSVDAAGWRERVLADPSLVLEDAEIMAALLGEEPAAAPALGAVRRVVDLRAAQVARLERRLEGLRAAHDDLAETALEALAGLDQTHRAMLALLDHRADAPGATGIRALAGRVRRALPEALGIEEARLCLTLDDEETAQDAPAGLRRGRLLDWLLGERGRARRAALLRAEESLDPDLVLLPRESLAAKTRRAGAEASGATILRPGARSDRVFFGAGAAAAASVAVIALDLGPRRSLGALALAAADPERFRPGSPAEPVALLGRALERLIAAEDAAEEIRRGLDPTTRPGGGAALDRGRGA